MRLNLTKLDSPDSRSSTDIQHLLDSFLVPQFICRQLVSEGHFQ